MSTGIRSRLKLLRRVLGTMPIGIVAAAGAAGADDVVTRHAPTSNPLSRGSVETLYFSDPQQVSVKVVRGTNPTSASTMRREMVNFGGEAAHRVVVFRGVVEPVAVNAEASPQRANGQSDPAGPGSVMLRGGIRWRGPLPADLFKIAGNLEFDHIADAVHGVESRYGKDLRMWRLDDLNGPQGPMQVSAAAAFDVGGGNRFDISENILLGRAYLAHMYRRYGSWSDALAAYNWGPGNVDQWIARGRQMERLPMETVRYIERVLRVVLTGSATRTAQQHVSKP